MACARVEAHILEEYDREVPSVVVGGLVMEELRSLDQVAYVRFASVYREFRDVSQFLEELSPMIDRKKSKKPKKAKKPKKKGKDKGGKE